MTCTLPYNIHDTYVQMEGKTSIALVLFYFDFDQLILFTESQNSSHSDYLYHLLELTSAWK